MDLIDKLNRKYDWLVQQVRCLKNHDCSCKENNTLSHNDLNDIQGAGPEYIHLNATEKTLFDKIGNLFGNLTSVVSSITGYGIDNTDPSNPVIQNIQDLPKDFFISTNTDGSNLNYLTDNYKLFDLQPFTETIINNTNEILRNGNDLFIIANSTASTSSAVPILIIRLEGCRIINNVLTPKDVIVSDFTVTARTHGAIFHREFIYVSTRPAVSNRGAEILKVNPYDFSDVKSYQFADNYNAAPNEIHGYKDWIYAFMCNYTTSPGLQRMVRISTDLTTVEEVFSYTNDANPNRRVGTGRLPFVIYNDEIYIVTTVNNDANHISLYVYDMNGNIVRNIDSVDINPELGVYNSYYIPHWMTIFNDKLIVSPTGLPPALYHKLLRFDIRTLELEEMILLPHTITDDNTIFSNGYLYLNGETAPVTSNLIKVKYNDFTDYTIEIAGTYSSTGSVNPYVEPESLKTKLSQFEDDLNAVKSISVNGGVVQEPDEEGNIDLSVTAGDYVAISDDTTEAFDSIALVTTLPGVPETETIYFIKETGIPSGETEVSFSGATFTLVPTTTRMYVTFTGTTGTITLPTIAGSNKLTVTFFNRGSGNLTINSNAGGNDIDVAGTAVNTVTVASNTNYVLHNNTIKLLKV